MPFARHEFASSRNYFVFTCDQSTGVLPSIDVSEIDIVRQMAKQRNSLSDQHRYAGDGEMADITSTQELLDSDAAIDIHVFSIARCQLVDDLGRLTAHLFDRSCGSRKIERAMA